jgi:hypothetical protein
MAVLEKATLQQMELGALGAMGVEYFAHPAYRLEVAKRLATSTGADHAIFFDDTAFAVPEAQRRKLAGLPGYERVMLPALLLSPGFKNGVSVLCAAPPNPVEIKNYKAMKEKMEHDMQVKATVRLMYEQGDTLVDLMNVDEQTYMNMCEEYAEKMENQDTVNAYTASTHIDMMSKYASQLLQLGKKTYVSPFQVMPVHQTALREYTESGQVVLPDIPNMDKAHNNFLLRKEGLGDYLHTMMAIHADGSISTDYDSYIEQSRKTVDTHGSEFEKTDTNMGKMADTMLACVGELSEQGMRAIIKLDSNGVSGLGNLMPDKHPDVYDMHKDYFARRTALLEKMKASYKDSQTLPQFAVVEEFIDDARMVEGFRYDLTAGGMMVGGIFMPMSMFPFGTNDDGEYDRGWIAAQAELVKEDPVVWKKIFQAYSQMGEVMARNGYRNGVLAGDVLVRNDGRIVFHDYNFRRGGRSTPEALIALMPDTGLFEVQLKMGEGEGLPHMTYNVDLFHTYTNTCQQLTNMGIYPFSTSFGYFGWGDGSHPFMKLKLLVPMEMLDGKTRDQHVQIVQELVKSLIN